jgi:hypothetical protein
MYKMFLFCGMIAILATGPGCKRHTEPTPEIIEGEGSDLMPVSLEEAAQDKDVVGPVADEGELEPLFAPEPSEGAGVFAIQNDTPQALAESYVRIANRSATLLYILAKPQQRESLQDYLNASQPGSDAIRELWQAIEQNFGDLTWADISPNEEIKQCMVSNIQQTSDTEATISIETIEGQNPQQIKAIRVDGSWWINLPPDQVDHFRNQPMDQVAQQSQKMAESVRDVVRRIRNGEITDVEGLRNASSKPK